jgi:protein SCO1/2
MTTEVDDPTIPPESSGTVLDWVRKYIWWIGGIAGVVMITAMRPFLIHRPPPPPVIAEVPADVVLTDQDGQPFSAQTMKGEVWVVGFMFTKCPSLCPQITSAMAQFQDSVARAGLDDEINLLSVSIDPQSDTPAVLGEYAAGHAATQDNWRFVTAGDKPKTEAFVVQGFKLGVGERSEVEPGVYDIAHSSKLALVDRNGGIRGFYSIDEDGLEQLFHRALSLVRLEEE